jgi:hypothetical protein
MPSSGAGAIPNHLLHEGNLRLCCDHGLAEVGFVDDCRGCSNDVVVEQISPPQIQF